MGIVNNLVIGKLHPITGEDLKPTVAPVWRDNATLMTDALCGGLYNKDTEPTSPTFNAYFKWNFSGDYHVKRITNFNEDNFFKLVNDFGNTPITIILDRILYVTNSGQPKIIPSNITLRILYGGGISAETNAPLQVHGNIIAGDYQIFYGGMQAIVFPAIKATEFKVAWTGAKGDNSTDDSDAITKAKNLAGVKGKLLFSRGATYIVNNIILDVNNQEWDLNRSTLKLKNQSSSQVVLTLTGDRIILRNGVIDGNKAQNAGGNTFKVYGTNSAIEDIEVINPVTYGLIIYGAKHILISKCKFFDVSYSAIDINRRGEIISEYIIVTLCTSDNTVYGGGFGIQGTDEYRSRNISIINNNISVPRPTGGYAEGCIGIVNGTDVLIEGNKCSGGAIGISAAESSERVSIINNHVSNFEQFGIEAAIDTKYIKISNNFVDCTGALYQGIQVNDSASFVDIIGNTIKIANSSSGIQINSILGEINILNNTIDHFGIVDGISSRGITLNTTKLCNVSGNYINGHNLANTAIEILNCVDGINISNNYLINFTNVILTINVITTSLDNLLVQNNYTNGTPNLYNKQIQGGFTLNFKTFNNYPFEPDVTDLANLYYVDLGTEAPTKSLLNTSYGTSRIRTTVYFPNIVGGPKTYIKLTNSTTSDWEIQSVVLLA